MEPDFWHERWANSQIGFHQAAPSPYLARYWPGLPLAPGARVLVPLCGKSLDMAWLVEQGHYVVGVELSAKAVQDYFSERQVKPQITRRGAFEVYSGAGCELWCGDIFNLDPELLGPVQGLYDRAAMIALPVPMRKRYVELLDRLLPASCAGLLVTLDYEQEQLPGPPFAVSPEEVGLLSQWRWQATLLEQVDELPNSIKARKAGATRLQEQVYQLER